MKVWRRKRSVCIEVCGEQYVLEEGSTLNITATFDTDKSSGDVDVNVYGTTTVPVRIVRVG